MLLLEHKRKKDEIFRKIIRIGGHIVTDEELLKDLAHWQKRKDEVTKVISSVDTNIWLVESVRKYILGRANNERSCTDYYIVLVIVLACIHSTKTL